MSIALYVVAGMERYYKNMISHERKAKNDSFNCKLGYRTYRILMQKNLPFKTNGKHAKVN